MAPNAYVALQLSTQGGNIAFSFALVESLGKAAAHEPSDVYVYPLNTAMAAQAIYESTDAAGKALAVLASTGISFRFNGVTVMCNATLAAPPAAQRLNSLSTIGSAIVPVAVVRATVKANFTTLGVNAFQGYGDAKLAISAAVHSQLGQSGKRLSDVVLRPSRTDLNESDIVFVFTDTATSHAFKALLAAGQVKLSWNRVTYVLQPESTELQF
jgi:hypothetical protein